MSVIPLPTAQQIVFDRAELDRILQLYGRMVAAGEWRDYAILFTARTATFSAFRRASERPEIKLVKDPTLRLKQGQYSLLGEAGQTLKRGNDLTAVLAPATRRLVKLVD
ncbi:DUF2794 domain-containing protein [Sandaracinobacter sp. RS1-74]|uniref:DUF2794 domain-containing protein n=1 Tax=Sandaracinobacteroides sayramensis TaxID=2913411 RepID=UPI001EDBC4C2|nr:DUF2794 domain-containing protein [Sandaracinobacteroides sayramensis]MCG2840031.1 DUF2794 domain-containing protein [Sandaracinobacteroides sayramensis]